MKIRVLHNMEKFKVTHIPHPEDAIGVMLSDQHLIHLIEFNEVRILKNILREDSDPLDPPLYQVVNLDGSTEHLKTMECLCSSDKHDRLIWSVMEDAPYRLRGVGIENSDAVRESIIAPAQAIGIQGNNNLSNCHYVNYTILICPK